MSADHLWIARHGACDLAAGIGALSAIAPAKAEDASATAAYKDIQATLGSVPDMFKTLPDVAVAGAWAEIKGVQLNPKTALDEIGRASCRERVYVLV